VPAKDVHTNEEEQVGQCIALYLVGFLEWGIVAFSDWEKEVRKAFKRMDRRSIAEQGRLYGSIAMPSGRVEFEAETPSQQPEES